MSKILNSIMIKQNKLKSTKIEIIEQKDYQYLPLIKIYIQAQLRIVAQVKK